MLRSAIDKYKIAPKVRGEDDLGCVNVLATIKCARDFATDGTRFGLEKFQRTRKLNDICIGGLCGFVGLFFMFCY